MKNRVFEEMDVPAFTDRTRASLKIQEGCNNFCTFCIIPWSRGLLRSRDPENVLKQAQQLVDAGYKEIVLTGKIGRHTSELQSRGHLVCRLLLEKKKTIVSATFFLFPVAPTLYLFTLSLLDALPILRVHL